MAQISAQLEKLHAALPDDIEIVDQGDGQLVTIPHEPNGGIGSSMLMRLRRKSDGKTHDIVMGVPALGTGYGQFLAALAHEIRFGIDKLTWKDEDGPRQ